MKPLHHFALHLVILTLLFSFSAVYSQQLTEQQRLERCQSNKNYIAENNRKINELYDIRDLMGHRHESVEDLSKLNEANKKNIILKEYITKETANKYDLKWNSQWDTDPQAFQKALQDRLVQLLLKARRYETALDVIDEIMKIEGHIKEHEDSLIALGCSEKDGQIINGKLNKQIDGKQVSPSWTGTWIQSGTIIEISGGNGSLSASFTYEVGDSKGTGGSWSGCKVSGNTAECKWAIQHEDNTKQGSRNGTLKVTLSGDAITGEYLEDEVKWSYKPGYSAANVSTSMGKGKTWPISLTRKAATHQ